MVGSLAPTIPLQWYNYRRSTPEVSKQIDIFAFGCVIYEILTGRHPYHEFEACDNRSQLVEQLYQEKQFSDTTNLPWVQLIQGCWHGTFNSVYNIILSLHRIATNPKDNLEAW